ncbi:MAG TPA: flavin reductase family protein [Candidatus Limnocylindria bacterium]|nr:flavin reductase family protein [Candidatus Limnocylindria bacterium]
MIPTAELRRVFGHFATGVTIVTTVHEGVPHGLTVNAYSSVSLEPPLVLVCLRRENRSYVGFDRAAAFAVNVLAREQEPLARLFASQEDRKFGSVAYRIGDASGAPLLDGAHAWLECSVVERFVPPGTHSVIIGEVLAYGTRDAEPLIYYRSAYRSLRAAP